MAFYSGQEKKVTGFMIPYFHLTSFYLGPFRIYVWGLMVALGVLVAAMVGRKITAAKNLSEEKFTGLIFWLLLAAFAGARLVHVFFYNWAYFRGHLWEIPMVSQGGLSSVGGFVGAATAATIIFRRRLGDLWTYGDVLAFVFPLGWGIGRIGCFLTHLHPGRLTNFIFAVNFPGGARHDLGLDEAVLGWAIFAVFLVLRRRARPPGFFISALIFLYVIPRFFLDFLRAEDLPVADARYAGATPAQYAMILFLFLGLWIWRRQVAAAPHRL